MSLIGGLEVFCKAVLVGGYATGTTAPVLALTFLLKS